MSRTAKRIRARWDFLRDRVYKTTYQTLFPAGDITPIFIVGCQRSGTNMLVRMLNKPGSTWLYNEGNNPAFEKYRLRADKTIQQLIRRSRAKHILFKPLCDSQWTDRLLTLHPNAKAIWIYRDYRDVARSAVRHWGTHQREVMLCIADGNPAGAGWQAERIQPSTTKIVADSATHEMSDMDGAVLKWLVRNQLFFDLKLAQSPNVLLLQYEDLVKRAEILFPRIFKAYGLAYHPSYNTGIYTSSVGKSRNIPLNEEIVSHAQALLDKFHTHYHNQELIRG